ncbi:TPA: hypothetical protein DEP96_02120 [Candidatus Uhrbacteria bacterium]|nr:hypothetical protein [Candidatus Uhrbacteria bacterium]
MDEIEKLLNKTSRVDRERLRAVMKAISAGELRGLNIKRLTNSNLFRVRVGDFRVIFTFNNEHRPILLKVRGRNEGTYRGL